MALFDEATLTRLRRLRLAAGRVQRGGARGERLSKQFGAGQEFGAHRPYTMGDDLRRVDWNVYGRLGQLFLKLFEQPGQLRVLLVADDAPTMDFGRHDKWLAARRVLAAIGLIALEGSEKVLLASLGRPQPVQFDGTGEARLLQLLEEMPVRAERGSDPFLQAKRVRPLCADCSRNAGATRCWCWSATSRSASRWYSCCATRGAAACAPSPSVLPAKKS
ncbi:MAG: DUF58 domain-containing protein [Planctomycetota bacterium]|nr:DUF58 domain-containing protein [Planctomycetota bacterium]